MRKQIALYIIISVLVCHAYGQTSTTNYIRTVKMLSADANRAQISIQYYDAKGRPSQYFVNGVGSSSYLRSYTIYDANGRVMNSSLPMLSGSSYDFVSFPNLITESQQSYNGDSKAWTTYMYDPLGRVICQTNPGEEWYDNYREIIHEYWVNESNTVLKYEAPLGSSYSLVQTGTYYNEGALSMERVSDEDEHSTEVYTNHLGQKIMERRGDAADTYYVYNDLGQLRFVLSPQYQLQKTKAKFAYEYRYDRRGRIIKKIIPGCSYSQYWYDKCDRVQFMQDATLRSKGLYRFTYYDELGRLVLQGNCTDCVKNTAMYCVAYTPSRVGICGTKYYMPRNGLEENPRLELVNYYDHYNFGEANIFSACSNVQTLMSYGSVSDGQTTISPNIDQIHTHGLLTGTVQKTNAGEFVYTVFFYDYRGRLVRTNQVYESGKTISETHELSFTGKPEKTMTVVSYNGNTYTTLVCNTYDEDTDKLMSSTISYNGGTPHQIALMGYDNFGRISSVQRGQSTTPATFTYNIRSWLKTIHAPGFQQSLMYTGSENLSGPSSYNGNIANMMWRSSNDTIHHGYSFVYDDLNRLTAANYKETELFNDADAKFSVEVDDYDLNGNILSMKRRGRKTDGTIGYIDDLTVEYNGNKRVSVTDDAAPVLLNGATDFKDGASEATEYTYNSVGALTSDANKGIESIEYDTLNHLRKVTFADGNKTEYVYTSDGDKLMTVHVTSPVVPFSELGDGGGEALAVRDTTEYVGNFIFRNASLERINFDGGYMDFSNDSLNTPQYHYFTTDHLGNIRAVFDDNGTVEQVTTYDPFGMIIPELSSGQSLQPYKYNGKEFDRMHGLDWYDYGARMYDPALPMWNKVDRFAEKYYSISPYVYCAGNPVKYMDINGDTLFIEYRNQLYQYENGKLYQGGSIYEGKMTGYLKQAKVALDLLSSTDSGNTLLNDLSSSKNSFTIKHSNKNNFKEYSRNKASLQLVCPNMSTDNIGSGGIIHWNPINRIGGPNSEGNNERIPAIGLAHELGHAITSNNGLTDFRSYPPSIGIPELKNVTMDEGNAMRIENIIRYELGYPPRLGYTIYENNIFFPVN